jgi:hypothetical protein
MRLSLYFIFLVAVGIRGQCADSSDAAHDSGDAVHDLLNLLIEKGVFTQEEAQRIGAEAQARRTNAPPASESKWKISDAIKNVELFGDIRFRYEHRQANDPSGGRIELDRGRFALRLGLRGDAADDFYYGLRLDTASNPRSPWVTFGTSSSGVPYNGPFGKSTAGINVGQAYIGYKPAAWVDLTLGKMPNPLFTTPMVWDSDLNPEGIAERFKHSVGPAEFFITLGQFLYQDPNPTYSSAGLVQSFPSGNQGSFPFLLAWQLGTKVELTRTVSAKVAATLYNYTGVGNNTSQRIPPLPGQVPTPVVPGFSDTFVGEGSSLNGALSPQPYVGYSGYPSGPYAGFAVNQTGINDLLVLAVPFELNFRLASLNARVFGEFAENLDGAARAEAAAAFTANPANGANVNPIPALRDQNKAYQVGMAIGNHDSLGMVYGTTSRKHGWEFRTYWQHTEQYALDLNLTDSDFFEGRGNLQGIFAALAYGLTDNLIATFRYGYAWRIDDRIGTGGSNQDIPQVNPIEHYNILQTDVTLRF